MTCVLSCNVNQACVVGFSVVICVSNTEQEAGAEGKHSVTADAEANLHCFQSLHVVSVMMLFTFSSSSVSCICPVSHFNS